MRSRIQLLLIVAAASLLATACGGGGSAPVATASTPVALVANQVPVTVEQYSRTMAHPNAPFVTVTVCDASGNCQAIDHVLLDTGSSGLRLMPGVLNLNLPAQTTSSGAQVAECAQYGSGYVWGAQRLATVKMAGEVASGVPVTVAGDGAVPASAPAGCAATGPSVAQNFGGAFNGILGIGVTPQDCGTYCAQSAAGEVYFACTGGASGSCTATTLAVADQTPNPVIRFASDNNGTVLDFPAVSGAEPSLTATLTFGIGTQPDNQLGARQVYPMLMNVGFLPAISADIAGTSTFAFLDSGTNQLSITLPGTPPLIGTLGPEMFPLGSAASACGVSVYCPSSPVDLTTILAAPASGNPHTTTTLTVSDPTAALQQQLAVIPGFATPPVSSDYSILGLPFFYGRSVMTAIDGVATPYGSGPFWAF
jgi:hypothetical protein